MCKNFNEFNIAKGRATGVKKTQGKRQRKAGGSKKSPREPPLQRERDLTRNKPLQVLLLPHKLDQPTLPHKKLRDQPRKLQPRRDQLVPREVVLRKQLTNDQVRNDYSNADV